MKCTSNTADTLYATITDLTGGLDSSYSHLFTRADGVKAGTKYACSIQLKKDDYTSGKSQLIYVTTLATIGKF